MLRKYIDFSVQNRAGIVTMEIFVTMDFLLVLAFQIPLRELIFSSMLILYGFMLCDRSYAMFPEEHAWLEGEAVYYAALSLTGTLAFCASVLALGSDAADWNKMSSFLSVFMLFLDFLSIALILRSQIGRLMKRRKAV